VECLQAFRLASQRAENILCVTVSSGLSTLYNSAREAQELAKAELPRTAIEVLDSETATPAEGFVALAAARAAAIGKDMAGVIGAAAAVREKVNALVFLDTIRHVYRSGRIPKAASQIGAILSIRPILTVRRTVHFSGAFRSRQHGIERLIHMMSNRVKQLPVHVAVMHAYAREEAEKLQAQIAAEFKCIELWLAEFSPIMGYACGTGTLGIAFYTEETDGPA
jgi:DegV family protein with EDD domain